MNQRSFSLPAWYILVLTNDLHGPLVRPTRVAVRQDKAA